MRITEVVGGFIDQHIPQLLEVPSDRVHRCASEAVGAREHLLAAGRARGCDAMFGKQEANLGRWGRT